MGFGFGTSKRHKEFPFDAIADRTLDSVFYECRNAGESGLVVICTNVHNSWVFIRVVLTNRGYSCLMKINSENAYEYDGVRSGDTKMSEIIPAKAIEDHEIYCRSVRITVIREDLDRHIASQKITLECLKERARTESNPALPKAIEGLEYAIYMLSQLNAESSDQDHIDARQISGDASRYINANCYR